jgi:hypothetical protein
MAEQFLDRAQIAAAGEEVRREGMAQRVRRRGFGQVERGAHLLHLALDDGRRERPALGAPEKRFGWVEVKGAEAAIVCDGGEGRGQDRDEPRLAALAGDAQDGVGRGREVVAGEAERFGNAQAAGVEQRQRGGVAGGDPGFFGKLVALRDDAARIRCRQRLGQRFRLFGRAQGRCAGGIDEAAPFEKLQQRADAGKAAAQRARACAITAPGGKIGAQVGRAQIGDVGNCRGRAEMAGQELE